MMKQKDDPLLKTKATSLADIDNYITPLNCTTKDMAELVVSYLLLLFVMLFWLLVLILISFQDVGNFFSY